MSTEANQEEMTNNDSIEYFKIDQYVDDANRESLRAQKE